MERDRIRQKVLEQQSQLLAMGAQEAGTIRFWIRQQYSLPPTDLRYLTLTEEQITLEYYAYLAASGARICSRCGTLGTDRFCVQCGNELNYGITKKCPKETCGARFASENWEYCPICGSELEMHTRYDPTYPAWADEESMDLGIGQPSTEDDKHWEDV
ncbi:hypothetical protein AMJ39_08090 [candidate division TA06 bacterium DG_24]|jgi:hypothetical protein|uniref:DZANK-type domain-containing protein n=2 Tax=Bacteria division TA06 TaxID=1156500 RepID=A0A0S8G8F8_UNCT6|nr:MAG: hypothetical protein AMJ39_08090 [candidate division TA06 bacterium DG_24]KPK68802.1 MAG: hypothetical protein AMJ82_07290 [candidate division TA06 bacterium SM23_40]